jgi:hypothetical protein
MPLAFDQRQADFLGMADAEELARRFRNPIFTAHQ